MIKAQAQIRGISTLSDGSMSVRIATQELPIEDKVMLMNYNQKFGWFLFSESEVKEIDVPKLDIEAGQKTKSQRLRGVIFKYWDQKGRPGHDFDKFYNAQMEALINKYKEQL